MNVDISHWVTPFPQWRTNEDNHCQAGRERLRECCPYKFSKLRVVHKHYSDHVLYIPHLWARFVLFPDTGCSVHAALLSCVPQTPHLFCWTVFVINIWVLVWSLQTRFYGVGNPLTNYASKKSCLKSKSNRRAFAWRADAPPLSSCEHGRQMQIT